MQSSKKNEKGLPFQAKQPETNISGAARLFLREKAAYFLSALAILIIITAAAAGWKAYTRRNESNAALSYEKAVSQRADKVIPALKQVSDEYSGTKAGRLALMEIGHMYYKENKMDLAIRAYEECLKSTPDDAPEAPLLLLSMAYCFEAKADYAQAIKYCERVKSGEDTVRALAYTTAGRLYSRTGKTREAVSAYKMALSGNGLEGPLRALVEWKMAQLTKTAN